jgi:hypothetical protein
VAHAWAEGSKRAELGTSEGESKGTQERTKGRGKGQVFMAIKKSGGAQLQAPSRSGSC